MYSKILQVGKIEWDSIVLFTEVLVVWARRAVLVVNKPWFECLGMWSAVKQNSMAPATILLLSCDVVTIVSCCLCCKGSSSYSGASSCSRDATAIVLSEWVCFERQKTVWHWLFICGKNIGLIDI